ncbi:MAG: polysaccharide deacetylase family protein [Candidatus Margulisbacteria bacterium]|nr:polysaccharide deacetylase family protein [Candidatus Margulisiibacteriota bacterium]MBU1617243.1 polysaccharide deacetylase family protein [Candidatus Margulisiibacteriota bacterium]MBU1867594.1 polysaccharide deacetylase family protein [Candidatus Margulisiibacteriota bacterium]
MTIFFFNRVIYCAVTGLLLLFVAGCAPGPVAKSAPPAKAVAATHSFKKFPVLEYHLIRRPEARWSRTPENFWRDLEWLRSNNYYPFNLRDILAGFPGLPPGKIPVVLTFDDSSSSQFRYLPNGEVDPECAVGIIKRFNAKYPDWPVRGTFFILVQTNNPDRNIFGQPENPDYKARKLRQLEEWGMEVASHTYSHDRLSDIPTGDAVYSLARSHQTLSAMTSRDVVSLALPMGLYPIDEGVFARQGQKGGYNFKLAAEVAGGLQPAPWEENFNPRHIRRIQTIASEWKKFFGRE